MALMDVSSSPAHSRGFDLRALLCGLISWVGLAAPALGQDTTISLEQIDRQITEVQNIDDVEGGAVEEALVPLQQAREEVVDAAARTERVDSYVQVANNSAETLSQLQRDLEAITDTSQNLDIPETSEALRTRLNVLQADQAVRLRRRAELQDVRTELAGRSAEIADEAATYRSTLDQLLETPAPPDGRNDSIVERARETLHQAQIFNRRAGISDFQRELISLPERQAINQARLAVIDAQIAASDREISIIQQRLSDVRMDRADAALGQALENRDTATDLSEPLQVIASENVELARTLRDLADEALLIEQDIGVTTRQAQLIRQQSETVERIIATGRITEEAGALLRQLRSSLPSLISLRIEINATVEKRASTQLNLILWQDRLRSARQEIVLVEPFTPEGATLPSPIENAEPDSALDSNIRAHRRDLLSDLIDAGQAQSDRLNEKEVRLNETVREAQNLRNTLDRRLLWLPSNTRPLSGWIASVATSARWLAAPEAQNAAWVNYLNALGGHAAVLLGALLVLVFAITGRRQLHATLTDLNDAVGKIARDKYATTPGAIFVCLALASPLPILLAGLSAPVLLTRQSSNLLLATAAGTITFATALLFTHTFRRLAAPDSVFVLHFKWPNKAITAFRRIPAWVPIAFCGLASAFVGTLASGRADLQNGIGLLVFLLASLVFAFLGYRTFSFERGVVKQLTAERVNHGLLLLGLLVFCIAPVVIGLLPLIGYLDTASALQGRVVASAGLLLTGAIFYGILQRILLIAQRRLGLRRAIERRQKRAAERAERKEQGEKDDDDEFIEPLSPEEELQKERQLISSQTERLLLYGYGVTISIGLFVIWATVLPALSVANDIALWTGVDTIDGVRTTRPVTLWNLILFFAFIIGGIFAAYNIRGLLEVGIFQRVNLSGGSRYAIQTIIGYCFVGSGVIAGFLQLGVDWSRLQWIIAALGVGLGFGLQEIVANFISGLIILFERPVRVGDTVNIGDLEGDVTNIAIRATTIRDFDNREVLLPNKSIITENVTNWTLRDSVVRIIIHIGVAYGSDVETVRDILLRIAAEEDDVLEAPEPRAFFMNHGDSSLDFELRVFISNPRKRFRVRDELNTAINRAFADAGIEIPFPQRDLHIRPSSL